MYKLILVITALLGALGVAFGALGAHALQERLGDSLKNWETGVRYQMIHIILILIIQFLPINQISKNTISIMFLLGILFFSGSLYVISLNIIPAKYIWFVTPIGGLLFIAGWLLLAWKFFKF